MIAGGTTAQNDAELQNVIERASEWVNTECEVNTLLATTDTETVQTRINRSADIIVYPRNWPIISVTGVKYRFHPTHEWTTPDVTYIETWNDRFVIRSVTTLGGWAGSLAARIEPTSYRTPYDISTLNRLPVSVQYTYVNGYPMTELSSSALVDASTVSVKSATAIAAGQRLTIYDNEKTEHVTVASLAGTTVTLSAALKFAHAADVQISALPASVKQATITLTASLIKQRGSQSVTMNGTPSIMGGNPYDNKDERIAKELLRPFKRVVVT